MAELENWDNMLINGIAQEAYYLVNKKFTIMYGLELTIFITYLISQFRYLKMENKVKKDGSFYVTDDDVWLYTTLSKHKIKILKRKAKELKFIDLVIKGIPAKTHYKLNSRNIFLSLQDKRDTKTIAYSRFFDEEFEPTKENLENLSISKLRLFCKMKNITYDSNVTTTKDYVNLILEHLSKESTKSVKNLHTDSTPNDCGINQCAKNLNSEEIEDSDYNYQKNDDISQENTLKCVKNLHTREQNNYTNHNINQHNINNHDNHDNEHDYFEKMFKEEFNVNYTKSNQLSIKNLRKKMSKQQVVDYLRETYNNLQDNKDKINNIAALFSSKIKKQERQINISSKKNNKKISETEIRTPQKEKKKIDNPDNSEVINFLGNVQNINEFIAKYKKIDEYDQLKIEEKAISNYISKNASNTYTQEELLNLKFENVDKYLEILQSDIINVIVSEAESYSAII